MRKHWKQAVILLALAGLGIALFGAGWHTRAAVAEGQCTAYPSHWNAGTGLCEIDVSKTNRLKWPHWEYQHDSSNNWVAYYFGDRGQTVLWGDCDRRPGFSLVGGDYSRAGPIEVDIDGQRQSFPLETDGGAHGVEMQILDEPTLADRLAAARHHITIRISGWTRSLKPAPELALFVEQCRQIRLANPIP
jgi:hypothetical protein